MLDAFVCIRVDVDQQPEIAQQRAAKAMPDLRLCDADGKELRQLLGFSSPERLLDECQRALDMIAGKAVAAPRAAFGTRRVEATPAAVAASVAAGCAFLERQAVASAPSDGIAGRDDAVLLGLVCGGRAGGDAGRALLQRVLAAPLTGTYQAAFRAMALARLDPRAHRQALEECLRFLADTQLADGSWSYGADRAAGGDRSNSAYALLGVDACARAGLRVQPELVQRAGQSWRAAQNRDGGWGYRKDREADSYASMTESGLASLQLCKRLGGGAAGDDEAVTRATAWLGAHASVDANSGSAYQQGRLLYHLYALERAGSLLRVDRFGDLQWYGSGAALLLGAQRDDGSWDDGADMPAANTVFALLFLLRATQHD
jgi:hypothetical protein